MRIYLYPIALIGFVIFWGLASKPLPIQTLFSDYWPSALTMIFGSFVAGVTPLGGGAVAFPVFTKVLDINALDSKYFSLLIQSVGMSFASLFLISRRAVILWRPLVYCLPLSCVVIPVTLYSGLHNNDWIKFAFSEFILLTACVIWLCQHSVQQKKHPLENKVPFLILSSVIGSFLSASIGSGSDVVMFFMLVFILKYPLKQAIPTTVLLMAFNALNASAWILYLKPLQLSEFVINSWWAAALVVAIGAPFGAWILLIIRESILRKLIYIIIIFELSTTVFIAKLPLAFNLTLIISSLLVLATIFINLHQQNKRRHHKKL